MEAITHNLVAVIIQIFCFQYLLFPLNIIFTIFFAYLSHLVVDALSKMTYHTPDVHKDDKFWVIWHVIIYSASILSIIFLIIPYWLGILFANIIDIWDWFILRPIKKRKVKSGSDPNWGQKWYLHKHADWVRDKFFGWLPNWRYKYFGIIIEVVIIIFLSIIIIVIL
ncbi:MAG: hypothetical protein ACTSP9_03595 [Promethearchaeota archaeon]